MAKEEIKTDRPSAQSIFQNCAAIRNMQYILELNPENQVIRKKLESSTRQMRVAIQLWGGAEEIDGWLLNNDPGHSLLSKIEEMDWSWL